MPSSRTTWGTLLAQHLAVVFSLRRVLLENRIVETKWQTHLDGRSMHDAKQRRKRVLSIQFGIHVSEKAQTDANYAYSLTLRLRRRRALRNKDADERGQS